MTTAHRTAYAATPALFLALLLPSCGGSSTPTGPSGGTATTPTPTPTPAPTPTPLPTPPPPVGMACANIPSGNGSPSGCSPRDSRHYSAVNEAVNVARSSTWVDPSTGETIPMVEGDGYIRAASAYVQEIIDQLDAKGLCAVYDGEEIQVRDGGVDNENFDVITSGGYAWINYVTTCQPALPIPDPPSFPSEKADPECPLAPSAAYYCVKQGEQLAGFVFAAQDALIAEDRARERSLVFNFNDRLGGTDYGYRIIEPNLYRDGMIDKLHDQGMCATFDGEEFNVKRGTNTFSENYDLNKFDGYAIRLYNATCHDASF